MNRCSTIFLHSLIVAILISGFEFTWGQEKEILKFKTHVVERGEKVRDVLKRYTITYQELIQHNPRLSRRKLRKGMRLKIPAMEQNEVLKNESSETPGIKPETVVDVLDSISMSKSNLRVLDFDQIANTYDLDFSELLYLHPSIRQGENTLVIDTNRIQSYKNLFEPSSVKTKIYSKEELDQLINKSLLPKNLIKLNPITEEKSFLNQLFALIDYQQNRHISDTLTEVERIKEERKYLNIVNQISTEKLHEYGINQTRLDELFLFGIDITLPNIEARRLSVHEKIKSQFLSEVNLNFQKSEKSLKIALLLPIGAKNFIELDRNKKIQDLNRSRNLTTISIDFLLGCELAIETAQEFGANVELVAFDTQNNQSTINQIINDEKISSYDVIIGPLIAQNFNYLSSDSDLIKVDKYFPISTNPIISKPNVYHTQTPKDIVQQKMLEYIESRVNDKEKNFLIVTDTLNQGFSNKLKTVLPTPHLIFPTEENYIKIDSVIDKMDEKRLNLIILASDSDILYSNAISLFSSIDNEENNYEIQLINTSIINSFSMVDLLSQEYNSLDLIFPSLYRTSRGGYTSVFENTYYSRFGKLPSLEAIRGYDIILDIVHTHSLRQGRISSENQLQPRVYNGFGFDYDKNESQGFYNTLIFLLRYQNGKLAEIVGDYEDSIW